jgi:nucleotide-binding universal stress UspA family protein
MKILLANDGSENSNLATEFLRRFPHLGKIEIAVVTCYQIPVYAFNETSTDWIAEYRESAQLGIKVVEEETRKIFQDTDVALSFITLEGHPGDEIVEYARKHEFDLIVLGAVGHSMLSRLLLGSVSDHVATHAGCSVLIVRPQRPKSESNPILNVTIAYDGSKQSKIAIDEFSRTNWGAKIEVHVVHASLNPYAYRERVQPIMDESASGRKDATLAQLNLVARQLPFTDPDPRVHFWEADHLGQSIVDFAIRCDSDIVMMGDTGQSAVNRMLLGSTSRYILRHAPMSVWIARRHLPSNKRN